VTLAKVTEQLTPAHLRGLEHLVCEYSRAAGADKVIIAYTPDSKVVAASLVAALRGRDVSCNFLSFEPLADGESLAFRIREKLPTAADNVVIFTLERDTMTGTLPLKAMATEYQGDVELVRVIGAVPEFLELAAAVTPSQLSRYNSGLLHKLMKCTQLEIRSPAGTYLSVELDNENYRWMSNNGVPGGGAMTVLPAGEINTYPRCLSGTFIADGAINVSRQVDFDVRLSEHPVTCYIQNNVMTEFTCSDSLISEFLDDALGRPFARNVGELGFGTNIGVRRFISLNSHINERHPGVHLGFGEHVQPGKVAYTADIHIDLISPSSYLVLDDEEIFFDSLDESTLPHPTGLRSEDVDGGD
jgi:hypothetical protein